MLALITATTLVNGVSGKTVEYVGSVQQDGYIYFNDQRFYRFPSKPLYTDVDTNAADVQMWYTQQNRWIRSNVFSSISIRGFDNNELRGKVNTAQQTANQGVSDAAAAHQRADDAYTRAGNAYTRADDAYTRANSAYTRADSAYTYAGNNQSKILDNGDALYTTVARLNVLIDSVNNLHGLSIPQVSVSIWKH